MTFTITCGTCGEELCDDCPTEQYATEVLLDHAMDEHSGIVITALLTGGAWGYALGFTLKQNEECSCYTGGWYSPGSVESIRCGDTDPDCILHGTEDARSVQLYFESIKPKERTWL